MCQHDTKLICDNNNGITTYWCKKCGAYRSDGNGQVGVWNTPENATVEAKPKEKIRRGWLEYFVWNDSDEGGRMNTYSTIEEALERINEDHAAEWTLIEGKQLKLKKKTIPQLEVDET